MPTRVLHIIEQLSLGGASRALVASAAHSTGANGARHRVLSLLPGHSSAIGLASAGGLTQASVSDLEQEVADADIVHIHFWNSPHLYGALARALPPARIAITCHVNGKTAPQVLTDEVVEFADLLIATSPQTLDGADDRLRQKAILALSAADFSRIRDATPSPHAHFNVGYIGAVDYGKMHPRFAEMHAAIDITEARFVVCGHGAASAGLKRRITTLGQAHRFKLLGYVNDIAPVLSNLDVFGYPLAPDSYATSELVLQEAMYAGLPCVVFAHGGAAHGVIDGQTGYIVNDEAQYIDRIGRLHRLPAERARMAKAAAAHARRRLGAENLSPLVDAVYERLLATAKRARAPIAPLRGAEAFMRSLGREDGVFRASLGDDLKQASMADDLILQASPALASASGGGVLHYRLCYPDDPALRFWAGLVLLGQDRPALAAAEFRAALDFGLDASRGNIHLGRAIASTARGPDRPAR